jgi:hypothetical protein
MRDVFNSEMNLVYDKAAAVGVKFSGLRNMLESKEGYQVAIDLISKSTLTEGVTKLWEIQRLDLSIEALALQIRFRSLFNEEVILKAKRNLSSLGYNDFEE